MLGGKTRWRLLEVGFFAAGLAAATAFVALSAPALITRLDTSIVKGQAETTAANSDGEIVPGTLGGSYGGASEFPFGSRIGTLSVPALHLSAPIVEGVGDADLRKGVGHVPGSAQAGGLGNVVLAAHRDAIFRPLRGVKVGMAVQISGRDGAFSYQVTSTQIVAPDRLDVTEISSEPEATMITCYPFNFVGSAPMRFVVKAHLVSAMPIMSDR